MNRIAAMALFLIFITGVVYCQEPAVVRLDLNEKREEISPMIFGQFIEFLGNCINGGIYDSKSVLSDENGFRKDVLEKIRELNPPLIRYPAGTYIKIFNWEDGIGPKDRRPRTRNLIWGGVEDNQFGTAEFITYCRKLGAEPNLVVNMSTGTAMDAANWVEYCNGTTDSHYANLRRSHGYPEPFNVRYWALGNEEAAEADAGRLQDPEEYIKEAWQFAKLMKLQDPSIKLVLCGEDMSWNKKVLDEMNAVADFLSVHVYVNSGPDNKYGTLLRNILNFERRIQLLDSLVSSYPEKIESWNKWYRFPPRKEPLMLAIDEWGMWAPEGGGSYGTSVEYNWEHALGTALFLNIFQNNSSRIGFATWAQTVNVLAPILADERGSVKQTVFYAMKYYREFCEELSVRSRVESPLSGNGIPALSVSATISRDGKQLTLFAVNLDPEKSIIANVIIENGKPGKLIKCIELNAPSVSSGNSLSNRDKDVVMVTTPVFRKPGQLELRPHSITVIRYALP